MVKNYNKKKIKNQNILYTKIDFTEVFKFHMLNDLNY